MNTEITSLQKRLRELELELQLNSQRSTHSTQTLEHVNAQTSKHQLWISHADNVIAETSTQLKITNQNMMVLNGNVQGCVSRSEVDGKFSVFKGKKERSWLRRFSLCSVLAPPTPVPHHHSLLLTSNLSLRSSSSPPQVRTNPSSLKCTGRSTIGSTKVIRLRRLSLRS